MFGWPNSTGRLKMGSKITAENTDVFEMWVYLENKIYKNIWTLTFHQFHVGA